MFLLFLKILFNCIFILKFDFVSFNFVFIFRLIGSFKFFVGGFLFMLKGSKLILYFVNVNFLFGGIKFNMLGCFFYFVSLIYG